MKSTGVWIVMVAAIVMDLTLAKIIELSHDQNNETLMNNLGPNYSRTLKFKGDYIPGVFVEFYSYEIGEHGGTHIDAPNHFVEGARSLSEIPIEDTILEGVMIDCAQEAANDSQYVVPLEKLLNWEKVHGRIPDRAGVIFNFNRSIRFWDAKWYYDTETPNDTHTYKFPTIGEEAADWMALERNVMAIAADTGTPDPYTSKTFPVHMRFLPENRLVLEHLNNPGLLPPRNFRFHFSPVKFVGGTGVQVRAYAVTYDEVPNHGSRLGGQSLSSFGLLIIFGLSGLVVTVVM